MMAETIGFGALVPDSGFRWIYRESKNRWCLYDPPENWSDPDYWQTHIKAGSVGPDEYSEFLKIPPPNLSENLYLAASIDECLLTHSDKSTEFGPIVYPSDLYLTFASERPTPSTIYDLANQFGLLRYSKAKLSIPRTAAIELIPVFDFSYQEDSCDLSFRAEKASDWLSAFNSARFNVKVWSEYQDQSNFEDMSSFLEDGFNYAMGGSLTYQVKIDPSTGQAYSEIIASSLADAIDIQWGMSTVANVLHQQCRECSKWFSIHPGLGRPEKRYCSDACRMRAYRKRKSRKI